MRSEFQITKKRNHSLNHFSNLIIKIERRTWKGTKKFHEPANFWDSKLKKITGRKMVESSIFDEKWKIWNVRAKFRICYFPWLFRVLQTNFSPVKQTIFKRGRGYILFEKPCHDRYQNEGIFKLGRKNSM